MVQPEVVGRVIRCYRRQHRMSQEVLSGLAGLDRTHYSKIERGLRAPTLETLFRIAAALEVPPHEIVRAIEQEMKTEESGAP